MQNPKPPKFFQRFLKLFCSELLFEEVAGDLEEAYYDRLGQKGKRYADRRYAVDVIRFFKPYTWKKLHFGSSKSFLISNYLKSGFRNLLKYRQYTILNALGLIVGMVFILLSFLYVRNELSYDKFHERSEDVFRVQRTFRSQLYSVMPFKDYWQTSSEDQLNYIEELRKSNLIESVIQINSTSSPTAFPQYYVETSSGEKIVEDQIIWTNSGKELFEVFTFEFIQGNSSTGLAAENTVVLSSSSAQKYFGANWNDRNLLNEVLIVDSTIYKVSAVVRDHPQYSHFDFDLIINAPKIPSWGCYTYIKRTEGVSEEKLTAELNEAYLRFRPGAKEDILEKGISLQPLETIYLESKALYELKTPGDARYLWIFSIVGVIVLIVTITNFFNLSIALHAGRQREIGIRKALGANGSNTIAQFIFESVLVTILCFPISLTLLVWLLDPFNTLLNLDLKSHEVFDATTLLLGAGLSVVIALFAGIYPSLVLSSKRTLELFKSDLHGLSKGLRLRKLIVGFQLVLLIGLGTATYFINDQLSFIQTKDLGFEKEGVLSINVRDADSYRRIKEALQSNSSIIQMGSGGMPGNEMYNTLTYKMLEAAPDFIRDNGTHIEIDQGSLDVLDIENPAVDKLNNGSKSVFLINDAAAEILALSMELEKDDLIGRVFQMEPEYNNEEDGTMGIHYSIDGIVDNFHYFTLKEEVNPLFIEVHNQPQWSYEMLFRIRNENFFTTIDAIKAEYDRWHPDEPIRIEFLEQRLEALYRNEQQVASLTVGLSVVAMVLALLGLIGLVSFIAKTKESEIGIRKVFGASIRQIIFHLNKEFLVIGIIATLVSIPLSYFALLQWLNAFAYRIDPNGMTYLLAGIISLIVVVTTVSIQSLRSAQKNPTETLRHTQ